MIVISIAISSCKQATVSTVTSAPPQLSLRESYENLLAQDSTIRLGDRLLWRSQARQALNDSIYVNTPYHEQFALNNNAMGLRIKAELGEQLSIITHSADLLVDIWSADSTTYRGMVTSPVVFQDTMVIPIDNSGEYLIRLQSKLGTTSDTEVTVLSGPQNVMPVVGAHNADVWSRFGDPREAGRRVHEGVDIFKRRGTIIRSASDGKVRTVKREGLGGKQVWVRDARLPISHYYAHLDSQYVTEGQQVQRGDTIGTVGNTGNARTTRPHLHYGMYTRDGAVDPFPFIGYPKKIRRFRKKSLPLPVTIDTDLVWRLRLSPSGRSPILTEGQAGTKLAVLGWTNGWWHVETEAGERGFVYDEAYLIASL